MRVYTDPYDIAYPFKVVEMKSGRFVDGFRSRGAALAFADTQCRQSGRKTHYRVYEVVWVGGSEKLEDHVPRASGL